MAEKDPGRKISVYRSVSLNYHLSEWRGGSLREENQPKKSKVVISSAQTQETLAPSSVGDGSGGDTVRGGDGGGGEREKRFQSHSSRSVSKIRSGGKLVSANPSSPDVKRSHQISPSIRQRSELFSVGQGWAAAQQQQQQAPRLSPATSSNKFGEREQQQFGKSEPSAAAVDSSVDPLSAQVPDLMPGVEIDNVTGALISFAHEQQGCSGGPSGLSYLDPPQPVVADQGRTLPQSPPEPAHWPSVPEMLKRFGESGFRRSHPHSASEIWDLTPSLELLSQSLGGWCVCEAPGVRCTQQQEEVMDQSPGRKPSSSPPGSRAPAADVLHSWVSSEEKGLGCSPGTRQQPPPPPPRRTLPSEQRSLWRSPALHKQEARQESDSLHSSHNCSQPQTAPTTTAAATTTSPGFQASSSDEEKEYATDQQRQAQCRVPGKVRSPERSSESEGDRPVAFRDGRKRPFHKKKSSLALGSQDESDSDVPLGDCLLMHEGGHGHSRRSDGDLKVRRQVSEPSSQAPDYDAPCPSATLPRERKHSPSAGGQSNKVHQSHKRPVRLPGESGTAVTVSQPRSTAGSPIPLVSRVARVTIQSFLQSPNSSRSSSRYSSTETLKEEDHFGSGCPGLSRSCQESLNMHRSPSFGCGDETGKHPQPSVRTRPRLPFGIVKVRTEGSSGSTSPQHLCHPEKSKYRKSMSNPDIAMETLTLLNILKSDFSGLRLRKERDGCDRDGVNHTGADGCQAKERQRGLGALGRGRGSLLALNQTAAGRPTLKELTATLRRARSFTCPDKPAGRRAAARTSIKPSSSELALASLGNCDPASPGGRGRAEEELTVDMKVKNIKEAGLLFEKIDRMWSLKGSEDPQDGEGRGSTEDVGELPKDPVAEFPSDQTVDEDQKVRKGESEDNLSGGKSADDLSGPESSMTDEGIVTEPETGSSSTLYREIPDPELVQKATDSVDKEDQRELRAAKAPAPGTLAAVRTGYESVAIGGDVPYTKATVPVTLEPPLTPSSIRRRRKFPPGGSNGSDSSNGSNGELNGETQRSLSDPMPQRRCSTSEEAESFSVDSNLLGSLNSVKGGGVLEGSATALSECTGSAASDLSVCSDALRDYNTVIQSIVREPGTMDKVIDDKGNGKLLKKKSLSDPSRRGDLSTPEFKGPGEPITEMEQLIPASSSEPILSEQRDEAGELEEFSKPSRKSRSQSERTLPLQVIEEQDKANLQTYSLDPKLAEVLSPRSIRRSSKKRYKRGTQQEGRKCEAVGEVDQSPPAKTRLSPKHIRHTSEPTSFIPVTSKVLAPETHLPCSQPVHITTTPEQSRHSRKPCLLAQTPSLEDVTKQYIMKVESSVLPTMDLPVTPTGTEPRVPSLSKPHEEPGPSLNKAKPQVDMRKHVMMTLLDAEQSYVESLRTLIQGYMRPLKQPENSFICDLALVDDMFFQIPEILEHHEKFLEQAHQCVQNWHEKQKVGDLMIETFSKDVLANSYSAYIDNFLNAKEAVRLAKEAKPAFIKFLEQCMRENKEKQALSDLMIKPVQRIPRYELLIKDLLKHTPEDHPDHSCLLAAQRYIKLLAERINKGKKNAEEAEKEARILLEIESHIEGLMDVRIHEELLVPHRKFLRQEMVIEVKTAGSKKERSLFLFTDLIICTTLKRKTGSLRRSSISLYTAASVIDIASKYKFLWKIPLEDLDIVKGQLQATNRENIQKTLNRLEEDFSILSQISTLAETLSISHQSLDDVIKDLMSSVNRELSEKQSLAVSTMFPLTKLEMSANTPDGSESFVFEFSNIEARASFEQAFEETKKKLALNKDHWDPEFLKAIPIMKTRSGMQFSCASPSHGGPDNTHEVWVCNSDGYVGQVCLLSVKPVPTVEACIAVCSARIICIAAVPGLSVTSRERSETSSCGTGYRMAGVCVEEAGAQQPLHISFSSSAQSLGESTESGSRSLNPFDSDDTEDDESSPSPSGTLRSQASRSTVSSSTGNEEMLSSKDFATETTSSEEEAEPDCIANNSSVCQTRNSDSPMDGRAMRRSSRGSFTRASLEELLSIDPEANQSSMWLGTEDGCIHVYQSSDNIRNRKNSMKMQHSAAVMCILYLDNKVFVSLANGELIAYQRDAGSFWDAQNARTLCLGSPGSPVTKMVPVAGKLWCGCQNRILIMNTAMLILEHTIQIGQDSNRCVTSLVGCGLGVWIALQSSAQVKLYHANTYENIAEVDVAPAVHKMLAGSDAIIRQHKAACLRITALLACKDLLWIGTSAGVVLTLSIPHITANTTSFRTPLIPMGSAHGHTGHVRFLTAVELPEVFDLSFPPLREPGCPNMAGDRVAGLQKRDSTRRRSSAIIPLKTNILVISGGDGYEDFRLTNSSETVGRDDSTNHLLLWRV